VDYYSVLDSLLQRGMLCHYFDGIESTNSFLVNRPLSDKIELCVTREQTHGKGQYGRSWQSQKDGSILFSLRKNFSQKCNLNGLSLVVGIAIVKALEKETSISGLNIKWPNDIYFDNKKLAGILLESQSQSQSQAVVIGVGINYSLDKDMICDTPWIDLKKLATTLPDIRALTASIVNTILLLTERFELNGFEDFQIDWTRYDMLKGRQIHVEQEGESISGEILGVSPQGALKVLIKNEIKELYSSRNIAFI